MVLRDVTHTEYFCGEEEKSEFSIYSNRFILFDKRGRKLNEFRVSELPNYLDLNVIETKRSGYKSMTYFVGFATTHIMLDICDDNLLSYSKLRFGEEEEG